VSTLLPGQLASLRAFFGNNIASIQPTTPSFNAALFSALINPNTTGLTPTSYISVDMQTTVSPVTDNNGTNFAYINTRRTTTVPSAFDIGKGFGQVYGDQNNMVFTGNVSQTNAQHISYVNYAANWRVSATTPVTITSGTGYFHEAFATGAAHNVTDYRGFWSNAPVIANGAVFTNSYAGYCAAGVTLTSATAKLFGYYAAAQSGAALNAAYFVDSNSATCGAGFVAGTAGDVCFYRDSAGVWTFNPGTSLKLNGNSVANVAVYATGGNLRLGSPVSTGKATTDTTGWPLMPAVSGTPTGVPQNETSLSAAFTWDRTNKKLCIRDQPTNAWICMTTPMELRDLSERIQRLEELLSHSRAAVVGTSSLSVVGIVSFTIALLGTVLVYLARQRDAQPFRGAHTYEV
jgi:hypothetical protein